RFRLAPVFRNLAGALRVCLAVATRGYSDEQIPTIAAIEVYQAAAVYSLFPYDTGDLAHFAPASIHGKGGDLDNYHLMLSAGCAVIGAEHALELMNSEAVRVWHAFDKPAGFTVPDHLWAAESSGDAAALHFRLVRQSHAKG